MGYVRIRQTGWAGWALDSLRPDLLERGVDALLERATIVRQRDCETLGRLRLPVGEFFVKTWRTPRERIAKPPRWWDVARCAVLPSRALQTLRATRRMRARAVDAAEVVLACSKRAGRFGVRKQELCVIRAVEGATLIDLLKRADADGRAQLAADAGGAVARMHRARVQHGDCLPGNMIVRDVGDAQPGAGRFCFIDNDRTRVWPFWLPERFARRNLVQMAHQLSRLDGGAWRGFVAGYSQARRFSRKKQHRLIEWVGRTIQARRARRHARKARAHAGAQASGESRAQGGAQASGESRAHAAEALTRAR